jgi:hypothetical protein
MALGLSLPWNALAQRQDGLAERMDTAVRDIVPVLAVAAEERDSFGLGVER